MYDCGLVGYGYQCWVYVLGLLVYYVYVFVVGDFIVLCMCLFECCLYGIESSLVDQWVDQGIVLQWIVDFYVGVDVFDLCYYLVMDVVVDEQVVQVGVVLVGGVYG